MLNKALCHAEHSRQHMQRKPLLGSTLLGRSICLQVSTNFCQSVALCNSATSQISVEASHCKDSIDVFAAPRTIDGQTSGP